VLAGRDPTPADAGALGWLVATLKESMRLYPPVGALMSRRVKRPMRVGGYDIPAGALLRITPWVIQRDARWFAAPDVFRPERFLEESAGTPRSAWMPFGAGPRVCIGQHFALLEMTLVGAMLLQRYALRTVPGTAAPRPVLNVTLRPDAALRLNFARRQGASLQTDREDGAPLPGGIIPRAAPRNPPVR